MSQPEYIPTISLTTIAISGPDAAAFMQSQLTLDIEQIEQGRLYPAAWCSPDGRADIVLLVAVEDGQVTLVLPAALVETARKRAGMYSIGRRVETAKLSEQVRPAPSDLRPGRTLALSFEPGRSLVIASPERSGNAADAAAPLPVEWLGADIACGMPWILPETAGMFLPQMLGLDALGGLSYRKGCFPGQEVIARVHYRGRVTRRLSRFRLQSDGPPAPGTEFEIAGKPACVLYAVADAGRHGESQGLAVVPAHAGDDAEIQIAGAAGTLVSR